MIQLGNRSEVNAEFAGLASLIASMCVLCGMIFAFLGIKLFWFRRSLNIKQDENEPGCLGSICDDHSEDDEVPKGLPGTFTIPEIPECDIVRRVPLPRVRISQSSPNLKLETRNSQWNDKLKLIPEKSKKLSMWNLASFLKRKEIKIISEKLVSPTRGPPKPPLPSRGKLTKIDGVIRKQQKDENDVKVEFPRLRWSNSLPDLTLTSQSNENLTDIPRHRTRKGIKTTFSKKIPTQPTVGPLEAATPENPLQPLEDTEFAARLNIVAAKLEEIGSQIKPVEKTNEHKETNSPPSINKRVRFADLQPTTPKAAPVRKPKRTLVKVSNENPGASFVNQRLFELILPIGPNKYREDITHSDARLWCPINSANEQGKLNSFLSIEPDKFENLNEEDAIPKLREATVNSTNEQGNRNSFLSIEPEKFKDLNEEKFDTRGLNNLNVDHTLEDSFTIRFNYKSSLMSIFEPPNTLNIFENLKHTNVDFGQYPHSAKFLKDNLSLEFNELEEVVFDPTGYGKSIDDDWTNYKEIFKPRMEHTEDNEEEGATALVTNEIQNEDIFFNLIDFSDCDKFQNIITSNYLMPDFEDSMIIKPQSLNEPKLQSVKSSEDFYNEMFKNEDTTMQDVKDIETQTENVGYITNIDVDNHDLGVQCTPLKMSTESFVEEMANKPLSFEGMEQKPIPNSSQELTTQEILSFEGMEQKPIPSILSQTIGTQGFLISEGVDQHPIPSILSQIIGTQGFLTSEGMQQIRILSILSHTNMDQEDFSFEGMEQHPIPSILSQTIATQEHLTSEDIQPIPITREQTTIEGDTTDIDKSIDNQPEELESPLSSDNEDQYFIENLFMESTASYELPSTSGNSQAPIVVATQDDLDDSHEVAWLASGEKRTDKFIRQQLRKLNRCIEGPPLEIVRYQSSPGSKDPDDSSSNTTSKF